MVAAFAPPRSAQPVPAPSASTAMVLSMPAVLSERAFARDMLPHRAALYGRALRLTRSPQDAHDLVQETLMKAWRSLHTFTAGTNAKAWLLRIQMNTFINGYRRRHKEMDIVHGKDAVSTEHEMVNAASKTATLDPANHIAAAGFSDQVRAALLTLPEHFRCVVLLSDVEGMSYQEAAEALHIPVGTVMSRLFRGRRLLQEQLFQHAIDDGVLKPSQDGAPGKPLCLDDYRKRRARTA
jgi:RNA polymerase sigma-70 factor, ECF subfamily